MIPDCVSQVVEGNPSDGLLPQFYITYVISTDRTMQTNLKTDDSSVGQARVMCKIYGHM